MLLADWKSNNRHTVLGEREEVSTHMMAMHSQGRSQSHEFFSPPPPPSKFWSDNIVIAHMHIFVLPTSAYFLLLAKKTTISPSPNSCN